MSEANESINKGNRVGYLEVSESRKPLLPVYMVIRILRIYAWGGVNYLYRDKLLKNPLPLSESIGGGKFK